MITKKDEAMREDDLKIFVKGTEHFFKQVTKVAAEVSMPFIKESRDNVMHDFSAVIGISGKHRGCVYYTAPREMIGELMGHFGETDRSDDLLRLCRRDRQHDLRQCPRTSRARLHDFRAGGDSRKSRRRALSKRRACVRHSDYLERLPIFVDPLLEIRR